MRWLALLILLLALLQSSLAEAQPSLSEPAIHKGHQGPPGSYPSFHAIPPLPYALSSPMQSLPPPQSMGAEEPLPPSAGHVISRPGYEALIHDDGRLIIGERFLRTQLSTDPLQGPRGLATFDIGDMLVNAFAPQAGQDPYLADKLELLHSTFAQRVVLREQHNELIMDRALAALPDYLLAVWEKQDWDAATRRRVLFALWDECAEGGNDLQREGGAAARRAIEDFIAQVLPPGSPQAFREEEITAFNQTRTSLAQFAP